MSADDTNVTLASNNINDVITNTRRELRNISEWMWISKLSAKPQKNRIHGYWPSTNKVETSETLDLNDSEIERVS